jgi:methionyl-tRNA synthetase
MPLDWGIPILTGIMLLVIPVAIVWSMAWKGIALWRAGRNAHLVWFIVLFIVNTLGILEIIYIFAFSRGERAASTVEG